MGKRFFIILAVAVVAAAAGGWLTCRYSIFQQKATDAVEVKTVAPDAAPESAPESAPEPVTVSAGDFKCKNCNIVIISLTNTRKDHLGIYGYQRATSKNIDGFFNDSIVFGNAYAPASWTLPVSASLYTSLFPYSHGVMDRYDGSRLSDGIATLTEVLAENGYKTAGFTGGGDYNRSFNISQGFDFYLDETNYAEHGIIEEIDPSATKDTPPAAYLSIEKLAPLAVKWLKENKGEKKFLLLQGFDTHCPFTPKEPFARLFDPDYKGKVDFSNCLWTFEQTKPVYEKGVRYWNLKTAYTKEGIKDVKMTDRDVEHMLALYDAEIAQADSYLEDFFKYASEAGLDKDTIFIFMSEHGDLFGEHGRFMRGGPLRGTFYNPVLNFPLLIKLPWIKGRVRMDSLSQTVDLMPTLLDILGLQDPQKETRQGKSLVPALSGNGEVNRYVYAASKYKAINNPFFKGLSVVEAIADREWKLIRERIYDADSSKKLSDNYELYNISKDPKEEKDIYRAGNKEAKALDAELKEWAKKFKTDDRQGREPPQAVRDAPR